MLCFVDENGREKMSYITVLWSYLLVSAPYLLFGLLISGAIHMLIPMSVVKKWLGSKNLSTVTADPKTGSLSSLQKFNYPGKYSEKNQGSNYTKILMENGN